MQQRKTLGREKSSRKRSRDSEREIKGSEDKALLSKILPPVSDKT